MTAEARKLLDDALALPADARAHLCEALFDSIAQPAQQIAEQEWTQLAVTRLEAYEANGGTTYSIDEVEARWQTRMAAE